MTRIFLNWYSPINVLVKSPPNANDLKSSREVYEVIGDQFTDMIDAWHIHGETSGYSATWYAMILGMMLGEVPASQWTADTYSDVALLYASCTNVISADVPASLERLSVTISQQIDSEKFRNMTPEDALKWLKSSESKEAGREFDNFLQIHGHRCLREIDIHAKTWAENPSQLVSVLQQSIASPGLESKKRQRKEAVDVDTAINRMKIKLTKFQKMFLRFAVPRARIAVGKREQTKSWGIKTTYILRLHYRLLSKLLVEESKLSDEDLLYYMTHYEIGQIIDNFNPTIIMRAQRRRKVFTKLPELQLPELMIGYPNVEMEKTPAPITIGEALKGTPVSTGKVRAPVRVAKNLQDAAELKEGEILITHATDIAWSVYFPMLGGVVTELGGLLSHGAVVAREYGLPCLVGVTNATSAFQTGDIAFLDMTTGTISKCE